MNRWLDRTRAWIHHHTRPAGAEGDALPAAPPSDEQIRAAWEPTTQLISGSWRDNPLLDLPLKSYAAIDKSYVWSRFVDWQADEEDKYIAYEEDRHARGPQWSNLDAAMMARQLSDAEADARHAKQLAWWKENQEPDLGPSDRAAAVSVWLWRNGLREKAVDVYATIWSRVRARHRMQDRIEWSADNALNGFRRAATIDPDWDDAEQTEFAALFRQRYVDPQINGGLKNLTNPN